MRLLFLVLLAGCGETAQTDDTLATDSDTGPDWDSLCPVEGIESNPAELESDLTCGGYWFETECSACHGSDGTGTKLGADITGHVPGHTDLELMLVMSAGTGDMPAQDLDSQQIADTLHYLRHTFGEYTGHHE